MFTVQRKPHKVLTAYEQIAGSVGCMLFAAHQYIRHERKAWATSYSKLLSLFYNFNGPRNVYGQCTGFSLVVEVMLHNNDIISFNKDAHFSKII